MSILRTENFTKSFEENIILQNVTVEIQRVSRLHYRPLRYGKSTFCAVNFLDPPTAGKCILTE